MGGVDNLERGRPIRRILRQQDRAALGTLLDGSPYVSLVLIAYDHSCRPLLLLSTLAEHTRNLKSDDRASLLIDDTKSMPTPLSGQRVTLQGVLQPIDDPAAARRYLARHPDAGIYAGFKDFAFYRLEPDRAHTIAGFGKIEWHAATDFILDNSVAATLDEAESDIVDHMNADHRDALDLIARCLAARGDAGWVMTGIDADGSDLRREDQVIRLPFSSPVANADEARRELIALVNEARARDLQAP
ncbi:hypothetical protein SAMN07250955_10276 [Arboricoccus pini]|uniref:Uncharacterized protein n=1 Tax=Arboricoccus pini TaxID=1963835 RepID=A0A212QNG4_9PROT|nr:DUF2470 domain-containing protein [Arboricoccus pini]SNB60860.1 hypothetical protein SAMN07250955_10276 [Arboricoccus pini]